MFSFGVMLSLKVKNKDRLELSFSLGSRLMFTFFFVLLCFALLTDVLSSNKTIGTTPGNILLLVLVCVTGLSTLYNEKWIFDKRSNVFENHFGIVILCRKQSIPLSELVRVELDSFIKGGVGDTKAAKESPDHTDSDSPSDTNFMRGSLRVPQRRILRLTVIASHEKIYVLDSARAHRIEEFRRIGRRIADFCSIPFRES